jgi:hypothetical protein
MLFHPTHLILPTLIGLLTSACAGGPDRVLVAVDGRVLRGPTQPVCRVDTACDAPFSAGFSVRQGSHEVTHFQSDTNGRFTLRLAAGAYLIVPDADAPIFAPAQQAKSVTIPDVATTTIELSFDTGIR